MRARGNRPRRRGMVLAMGIAGLAGLLVLAMAAPAGAENAQPNRHRADPSWTLLPTGNPSHFRGLAPVSRQVAWLGGYNGLVLRTTDGGRQWQNVSPPGADTLQFR